MLAPQKGIKTQRDENALRRTGWRPPLIPGEYQELVFTILGRPEYEGKPARAVIEDALQAFATEQEIDEVDWRVDTSSGVKL